MKQKRVPVDAYYWDGYSAQVHFPEKAGDREYARRQFVEFNVACFRQTRQLGIIPGAELPRFWNIADCDFYFCMNWSKDYMPVGEPIPWLHLVFHDCFIATFAGGGYGHLDWPADRHPRLYELLFTAMPSYTFAGGKTPTDDWDSPRTKRFCAWLMLWRAYHVKTKQAEMTSHEFLSESRKLQRLRFANGVTADFDFEKNMVRIEGIEGFSGDWQRPFEE